MENELGKAISPLNTGGRAKKGRGSSVSLQALEAFCEVVRQQSFSRGAEVIGISQSAASQLVAHLEAAIGFRLIDRKHRPLLPTAAGRTYFMGCQDLLRRHREILEAARRGKGSISGTIRVAAIYSVGLHTLNQYMSTFMARHPDATVYLEYYHPSKVYSAVLDGEAEIGVVSYPRQRRGLDVIRWLDERMVIVCPKGHRLARLRRMPLAELRGEKFVAFDPELEIRREIDRALRVHKVKIEVVSEFDNIETIKQALVISDAVSILPRPSVQKDVERGNLAEVHPQGISLKRPVGIIHRARRELSPVTQKFVAILTGHQDVLDLDGAVRDRRIVTPE